MRIVGFMRRLLCSRNQVVSTRAKLQQDYAAETEPGRKAQLAMAMDVLNDRLREKG